MQDDHLDKFVSLDMYRAQARNESLSPLCHKASRGRISASDPEVGLLYLEEPRPAWLISRAHGDWATKSSKQNKSSDATAEIFLPDADMFLIFASARQPTPGLARFI